MSRIVVLGGGESGVGAAVLAKVKGFDVFLSDNGKIKESYAEELRKWDIPFEEGGHTEEKVLSADEVVKSPGVPSTVKMVRELEDKANVLTEAFDVLGSFFFDAAIDETIDIDGANLHNNLDNFEACKPVTYTVTLTTETGEDKMADEIYLGTNKNE